jgi:low affinity Fe/Cu permease
LSRLLRAVDALSSKAGAAATIAAATVGAVAAIIATGFPHPRTSAFTVNAAGIPLVMVFVIQHTQSREQTATKLKLDELIRAQALADDHLVRVEAANDEELSALEGRNAAHHESLRSPD